MSDVYLRLREHRERALRLTADRRDDIAREAAWIIYRLGRKVGRRFINRNTVSRTKILRALYDASWAVLGVKIFDPYATYRTFDGGADSATWRETLAMLRRWVESHRRAWLENRRSKEVPQ